MVKCTYTFYTLFDSTQPHLFSLRPFVISLPNLLLLCRSAPDVISLDSGANSLLRRLRCRTIERSSRWGAPDRWLTASPSFAVYRLARDAHSSSSSMSRITSCNPLSTLVRVWESFLSCSLLSWGVLDSRNGTGQEHLSVVDVA